MWGSVFSLFLILHHVYTSGSLALFPISLQCLSSSCDLLPMAEGSDKELFFFYSLEIIEMGTGCGFPSFVCSSLFTIFVLTVLLYFSHSLFWVIAFFQAFSLVGLGSWVSFFSFQFFFGSKLSLFWICVLFFISPFPPLLLLTKASRIWSCLFAPGFFKVWIWRRWSKLNGNIALSQRIFVSEVVLKRKRIITEIWCLILQWIINACNYCFEWLRRTILLFHNSIYTV